MRRAVGVVALLAVGAVVAVAAIVATGVMSLGALFGTETIDRSQPVLLLTSIQDISRVDAAVGNFEVVLDHEEDVTFVPGFLAGRRSLFVAAGTVDAYVDFSTLTQGDLTVSADGTEAVVQLPAARLGRPNLAQDRTYLFSQDRGVVDRIGDALPTEDQQQLYQRAERRLMSAATGSELRNQAEDNTRTMLVGLFDALDVEVTVAFDAPGG